MDGNAFSEDSVKVYDIYAKVHGSIFRKLNDCIKDLKPIEFNIAESGTGSITDADVLNSVLRMPEYKDLKEIIQEKDISVIVNINGKNSDDIQDLLVRFSLKELISIGATVTVKNNTNGYYCISADDKNKGYRIESKN